MYLTKKDVIIILLSIVFVGCVVIYKLCNVAADETKPVIPVSNNHGQYAVETYSRLPEWIRENPEKKIECIAGRDGRICIVYRIEQNK